MSMIIKEDGYELTAKYKFYQVIRGPYIYTIGVIYYEELYDISVNNVFYGVSFLMLK